MSDLTLDEYQRRAAQTIPAFERDKLINMAIIGMLKELAEVAGPWDKHHFQGHPAPDPAEMQKEIGDVLWYLAAYATAMGLSLGDIARTNNAKLLGESGRYPDGTFDPARSINRETADHA
jgi:NTP pyrophosphatase (non-canonical NTP hydrolase)